MPQPDFRGVQEQPLERDGLLQCAPARPVAVVAQHRMADRGGVNTNLVGAPGYRHSARQRGVPPALARQEIGSGQTARCRPGPASRNLPRATGPAADPPCAPGPSGARPAGPYKPCRPDFRERPCAALAGRGVCAPAAGSRWWPGQGGARVAENSRGDGRPAAIPPRPGSRSRPRERPGRPACPAPARLRPRTAHVARSSPPAPLRVAAPGDPETAAPALRRRCEGGGRRTCGPGSRAPRRAGSCDARAPAACA